MNIFYVREYTEPMTGTMPDPDARSEILYTLSAAKDEAIDLAYEEPGVAFQVIEVLDSGEIVKHDVFEVENNERKTRLQESGQWGCA